MTTLNFSGEQMPHQATAQRYVVQKSTSATLNFAAVMAVASRVYADFDEQSAQLNAAAVAAWEWAQANPEQFYVQGNGGLLDDVRTGVYGDRDLADEFAWAAAELFILTGDNEYFSAFVNQSVSANIPGWRTVNALPFMSLAHRGKALLNAADYTQVTNGIFSIADNIVSQQQDSAYGVPMVDTDFFWGSNSQALNKAIMLIQAYRLDPKLVYLNTTYALLDYILGRNATGYAFVTGFGYRSPVDIHHRVSVADGIAQPVPGFIAGGPYNGQVDGCVYPSTLPAKSYLDSWCSYSTNEVTINWNAPLIYLLAAVEVLAAE